LGNKIVPVTVANIPMQKMPLSKKDSSEGRAPKSVPTLFYSATVNDTTGTLYLKIVNTIAKKQTVKLQLDGLAKVAPEATLVVVKGNKADETNSITDRERIIPVTEIIKGIKKSFSRTLDPYSVSIFEIKTNK
jgi:alpha-N-arabinofuranosidase